MPTTSFVDHLGRTIFVDEDGGVHILEDVTHTRETIAREEEALRRMRAEREAVERRAEAERLEAERRRVEEAGRLERERQEAERRREEEDEADRRRQQALQWLEERRGELPVEEEMEDDDDDDVILVPDLEEERARIMRELDGLNGDGGESTTDESEHEDCPICLEPMEHEQNYPCDHKICFLCHTKIQETPQRNTCPMCREDINRPRAEVQAERRQNTNNPLAIINEAMVRFVLTQNAEAIIKNLMRKRSASREEWARLIIARLMMKDSRNIKGVNTRRRMRMNGDTRGVRCAICAKTNFMTQAVASTCCRAKMCPQCSTDSNKARELMNLNNCTVCYAITV